VAWFAPTSDTVAAGAIDDERVGFDVNCKPADRIDPSSKAAVSLSLPAPLDWDRAEFPRLACCCRLWMSS
jgi:hypothetical protein